MVTIFLGHRQWCATMLVVLAILLAFLHSTDGQADNPHGPVCNSTFIRTNITEPQPTDYLVVNLDDYCWDPDGDTLIYTIIGDNNNQQFKIGGGANSEVLTNKVVDAEARLSYEPSSFATPWTLRIMVNDSDPSNFNVTFVSVFIEIISINDNAPTMENLPTSVAWKEDTPVGTVISTCTLQDLDLPSSDHAVPAVKILAGNDDGKFFIDKVSCDIVLISPLDYESVTSYTLTLQAYDNGSPSLNTTQDITINVTDVNDNAPNCSFTNRIIEVNETLTRGQILLTLDCDDIDTEIGAAPIYELLPPSTIPELDVNETTGEVMLNADLDYDKGLRFLELFVRVKDAVTGGRSTTVSVKFVVTDVDDQPPVFTSPTFSADVDENANLGQIVLTVTATDDDSPNTPLSEITYGWEVPCTEDWFVIDSRIGAIFVNNFLDAEIAPVVDCWVYAYSSDKYNNRTVANVTINIIDINDQAPIFSSFVFEGQVSENVANTFLVLTVNATDPDIGINGMFDYIMPFASPFQIGASTGKVTVKDRTQIDYETKTEYKIQVEARDRGTPPMTSTTTIAISVLPVNEFDPVFQPFNTNPDVSELGPPGTLIVTISATDQDDGLDGEVEYFLNTPGPPVIVERQTGRVLGLGFDFETTPSYAVELLAVDKSLTTPRTSTATMTINVLNGNDHDPTCNPLGPITVTPTTFNIDDVLGTLQCSDDDGGGVRYTEISGDPYSIFQIDSSQGIIRLKTQYVAGTYTYLVAVSDTDTPPRTTTVAVEIRVSEALTFNPTSPIDVPEDTQVADIIRTFSATGSFSTITYDIVSDTSGGKFYLHSTTGALRLLENLDRETTDQYTLGIKASTSQGQSISKTVTIKVTDVNDNVPKYPNSFTNVTVSEGVTPPVNLAALVATDPDLGNNGSLSYFIMSGNGDGKFDYDSSGNLMLVGALDYDTVQSYTLVLAASDGGNPALTGTTLVFVVVQDVDEHMPVIVPSGGTIALTLSEDLALGSRVIHINASDMDAGSQLTYEITSGNTNNTFTIDGNTGDIYLSFSLDRETRDKMNVVVVVTNTKGQTATTTLVITITDVNDNQPNFDKGYYAFSVPHGTPKDTDIGTLGVTDPDIGVNKDITLTILSGDTKGWFKFSANTLQSNAVLDANIKNKFELEVEAKDAGTPSLSSTAFVTVTIEPEFKQPLFVPDTHTMPVSENETPGTLIYDTDATWAGATEHAGGDLSYEIISGNAGGKFYVEQLSGTVQLVARLDYATATSYSLVIEATNVGNTALRDTFTLNINVIQVNKFDPVFTMTVYAWDVNEDAAVSVAVGQVAATDQDPGNFGQVKYGIEPNSYFTINQNTGRITLVQALEYSVAKSFNFYVTAMDNAGAASRTATSVVFIQVIDKNNHAPYFPDSPYEVTVSESSSMGDPVLVVAAVDLDSGAFGTVQYSIDSGNANNIFNINSVNGYITVNNPPDYETSLQHVLTILGVDGGSPALTGTATVTADIKDENDHDPQFATNRVDLAITSDTAPLTPLYTVHATDADSGSNGQINYFIESGNNDQLFSIDTMTGIITTTQPVDSDGGFYNLVVAAVDQGMPSRTGTTTVGVTIRPVQSAAGGDFIFIVSENEAVGTFVGTITKGSGLTVSGYTITGGNFGTAFAVSMDSSGNGILMTAKTLDRENYAFYQLHVDAQHSTGVETYTVSVTVEDDNDNSPVFHPQVQTLSLVENLAAGKKVGALSVTDADATGVNSEYDLAFLPLTPLGSTYFDLSPTSTGADLLVAQPVSYEVFQSMTFYVVATDRGSPQRTSTGTVMINVVNVPETISYTPIESAYFVSSEFPDDLGLGDAVYTVKPIDVNVTLASGDTIRYTTVDEEDSVFVIHSTTGVMSIQKPKLIFSDAMYTQWIIATWTSGGVSISRALMVRMDTFSRARDMVVVSVSMDDTTLRTQQDVLQSSLQSFFTSPEGVRIWTIVDPNSSAQRRRLLATTSDAYVVVVADNSTDSLANLDQFKTFVPNDQVATALQSNADGTPQSSLSSGAVPVTKVVPYEEDDDDEILSTELIILIVFAILALIIIILVVILVVLYCTKRRRKQRDDKRRLMEKEKHENGFKPIENSTPPESTSANFGPAHESTMHGGGRAVSPGNMENNTIPTLFLAQSSKPVTPAPPKGSNSTGSPKKGGKPTKAPRQPDVRADPSLDPDRDGAPTRASTATHVSSYPTRRRGSELGIHKNSSTMLESLEEDNEYYA